LEFQSRLGLVKDLGRLASLAQEKGIPAWEVGNQDENDKSRAIFYGIARKIIERSS
jgi:uncharacterized protein YpmB